MKQHDTLEMRVIIPAMGRNMITDRTELARMIGLDYQALRRRMIVAPGSMRLYELASIHEECDLTPVEVLALATRKEVRDCEKWLQAWLRQHPLS